jgi:hypothetical protein
MTEAQIKSVALFFFYVFADKARAFSASAESIQWIGRKQKKLNLEAVSDSILVFATYKVWKKYSHKKIKPHEVNPVLESGWVVPTGLKLEQWWQFSKQAEPIIVLTLIWSILLGIEDKHIAEGLGVTEGTVRYRTGNGLKVLGGISGVAVGPI